MRKIIGAGALALALALPAAAAADKPLADDPNLNCGAITQASVSTITLTLIAQPGCEASGGGPSAVPAWAQEGSTVPVCTTADQLGGFCNPGDSPGGPRLR